jgi:hypothetical protein
MKAKKEGEELIKVGYRLPPSIIQLIEKSAIEHRRSVNDEVIVLLEKALGITTELIKINAKDLYAVLEAAKKFGIRVKRVEHSTDDNGETEPAKPAKKPKK